MRKYVIFFLFYFFGMTSVWAIDPRDSIPDTTLGTPITLDHHCVCKKVSNSTGKTIFVGWRTLAEWASFYNGPPTNVTAGNCVGVVPSDPTIALPPSYTTTPSDSCSMQTGSFTINNVQNSGGYSLRINIPAGFLAASCNAYILKNNGDGYVSQALTLANSDVTVCNGSEYYLQFDCPTEAARGPFTISIRQDNTITMIDSFTIEFFDYGNGGVCQATI